MSHTYSELCQKLVDLYHQESAVNQHIIQGLSVIYEPVTRTDFLDCLKGTEQQDNQGNSYNSKTLKPHLDHLLNLQLLVEKTDNRGQKGICCHPAIVELVTQDAVKQNKFEEWVKIINTLLPIDVRTWGEPVRRFHSEAQLFRELRIGLYRKDWSFFLDQIDIYKHQKYCEDELLWNDFVKIVLNNPFSPSVFCQLPQAIYERCFPLVIHQDLDSLKPVDEAFNLLLKTPLKESSDSIKQLLLDQLILRNRFTEAQHILNSTSLSPNAYYWFDFYSGLIHFFQGDYTTSIRDYTKAYKSLKTITRRRKVYFDHWGGVFFILALIQRNTLDDLQQASDFISIVLNQETESQYLSLNETYPYLDDLISLKEGNSTVREGWESHDLPSTYSFTSLIIYFCIYWLNPQFAKPYLSKPLNDLFNLTEQAGYHWLAAQVGEFLLRVDPQSSLVSRILPLTKTEFFHPLIDLINFEEPWQLSLNALINFNLPKSSSPKSSSSENKRLAWFVSLSGNNWSLSPREQSLNKKGVWSAGRPIALKRLAKNPSSFGYLTPQDFRVCTQIFGSEYGYYGQVDYSFEKTAIAELIGHPLVFWEQPPHSSLEIVKAEPELLVKKGKKQNLILKLLPKIQESDYVLVWQDTPSRLKVLVVTSEHRKIAHILNQKGELSVPLSAEKQVLKALNTVSSILTIHSDIGGVIQDAEEVEAQVIPYIQLVPMGEGLKVGIFSCPFGQGKAYYLPGKGGETVITEQEGKRLQTTRNLKQEKALADAVINQCSVLNDYPTVSGEWQFNDPQICLELLLQLQELKEEVVIEWPEGQTLSVTNPANFANLHLKVQGQQDWFEVTGELKLDEHLVLEIQQLLTLLEQSPSRFIPLGEGRFLALTESFRKRLDEFRLFSEKQGKGRKLHPLSSLALQDFFSEVEDLKTDKKWKEHCQKLQEMQDFTPQLPSTFQGELRDYQLEGFNWLSRLAYWGVGACLADDMGLGKTIQALAVILTRATQGVTLIIAPTSVCFNWIAEVVKFAPTLNPIYLGTSNRETVLSNLQPMDLVICSYGLLQQESVSEMLGQVQWETIVLDEAQFIKNMTTKRSQAAMQLQGNFKLITTGTPIENHLGELWNLFRFINPGLLGSFSSFKQRFMTPIENFDNSTVRHQLKRLIQPFILRRTKTQVLEELPPRTEMLVTVELSPEEMALYEVLRREAVEQFNESEETGGQKHLQVLAALMKLRRCCCNPRLVMADSPLSSSKLEACGEILEELRDNHHKALIFSQFVDHLQIVKNYLEQQNITYQYLDGSTPMKEREKRVKAFQSGEGDVFLISLKAGGTGLNLTAADYVIHLDPWWNPAVEDQASDRAYRIGQQRPVTIYRLVAKDTIEEKIVQLHHHKRDLADSLLSGADVSSKLSTQELLDLIS